MDLEKRNVQAVKCGIKIPVSANACIKNALKTGYKIKIPVHVNAK